MNEITTLFTAIGDFFTNSNWYQMVKWPFWILLFTVAAGGVYTARFGKKTLLCQGVAGTLNLLILYMVLSIGYTHFEPLRTMFSELPFLSVTDKSAAAVNPWGLNMNALPPVMLRLMILIFLLNLTDSFGLNPKTLLTWMFSQFLSSAVALGLYAVITAGFSMVLPSILGRYAVIPVAMVVVIGFLMICAKFIFTVVITGGNPYFSAIYKFFTVNRGGSLFTTSAVTFLLSMIVLSALNMTGSAVLVYAGANTTGLLIILLLCLAVLYIFSMFYNDRKKG